MRKGHLGFFFIYKYGEEKNEADSAVRMNVRSQLSEVCTSSDLEVLNWSKLMQICLTGVGPGSIISLCFLNDLPELRGAGGPGGAGNAGLDRKQWLAYAPQTSWWLPSVIIYVWLDASCRRARKELGTRGRPRSPLAAAAARAGCHYFSASLPLGEARCCRSVSKMGGSGARPPRVVIQPRAPTEGADTRRPIASGGGGLRAELG